MSPISAPPALCRGSLRLLSAITLAGAIVTLPACDSGQTGGEIRTNEGGNTPAHGDHGYCADHETSPLDTANEAELGFDASTLMQTVAGIHEAGISWAELAYPLEGATVVPEAGTGTVTVTITPIEGTAQLVRRGPREDYCQDGCPSIGITDECDDQLRFDADVHIITENGALNDSWRATFSASSPHLATASIELSLDELDGSFAIHISDPDTKLGHLRLDLAVAGGQLSGAIVGDITTTRGELAIGQGGIFARFPRSEGCRNHGHLIDRQGALASAAKAAIEGLSSFDLTWSFGGETTFMLDHEITEACLYSPEHWFEADLILFVDTHAQTEDGGIDGTWQLEAHIKWDESGAPATVRLLRQAHLATGYPADAFATATGITAIEIGDELQGTFSFSVENDLTNDQPATGEFTVLEVTPAPGCEPDYEESPAGGASAGGCQGSTHREIGGAIFVAR